MAITKILKNIFQSKMIKQTHTHTHKGFSVITDYPKDVSQREAFGFTSSLLWCAQDTHWEFIPRERKGNKAKVPCFCCIHLKTALLLGSHWSTYLPSFRNIPLDSHLQMGSPPCFRWSFGSVTATSNKRRKERALFRFSEQPSSPHLLALQKTSI